MQPTKVVGGIAKGAGAVHWPRESQVCTRVDLSASMMPELQVTVPSFVKLLL